MDEDERIPIGEVLSGLEIHPLEPNDSVVSAFVLVKVLDADGDVGWSFRTSEAPNKEELLGALDIQLQLLRKELLDAWDAE